MKCIALYAVVLRMFFWYRLIHKTNFGYWKKLDLLSNKFLQTRILSTHVVTQSSDLGFYIIRK